MSEDYIAPHEWIRPGQLNIKPIKEALPDKIVSEIVGKRVNVNNPKLINLVNKWRSQKDPEQLVNFLKDPSKIAKLKREFK